MSDLTLPGSVPGLLRRGSPVLAVKHAGTGLFRADNAIGFVFDVGHNGPPASVLASFRWQTPFWAATKYLALDLTDATGRAHAAWWLAAQHGEPSPTTEVWDFCPETTSRDVRDAEGNHLDLIDGGPALWMCGANGWTAGDAPLADLDPNDPRILPDGSRWVDAEALRRVCLHVAGLS